MGEHIYQDLLHMGHQSRFYMKIRLQVIRFLKKIFVSAEDALYLGVLGNQEKTSQEGMRLEVCATEEV